MKLFASGIWRDYNSYTKTIEESVLFDAEARTK